MFKNKLLIFLVSVYLFALSSCVVSADFFFVHISDTHINSPASGKKLQDILNDIESLPQRPAFIINTGDITETGSIAEFRKYAHIVDSSAIKIYSIPGNHDVRWSNTGFSNYKSILGDLYQSFEYGGVKFILLNSSMLLEQYGHFSIEQLNWLKRELQKTGKTKPIIFASHHPLFTDSRYIDNEIDFLNIINEFNIMFYLCGHKHKNEHTILNNIHFTMTAAVKAVAPGYRLIHIKKNSNVTVQNKDLLLDHPKTDFTFKHKRRTNKAHYSFRAPSIKRDYTDNLPVLMTGYNFSAPEVGVDCKNWIELKKAGRKFFSNIDISGLTEGLHDFYFRYQDQHKNPHYDFKKFRIDRSATELRFKLNVGSEIRSAAVYHNQKIYFGTNDGAIYCVSPDSGKIIWNFKTSGPVVSTMETRGDTLFATSGNGHCYAINCESGARIWSTRTGRSIFSSPRYGERMVFFGCSDSSLYALQSSTGDTVWTFKSDGFIKSRPAVKDGYVFFGSWDGYFYCLSALNGHIKWKTELSDNFYYAPATSDPVVVVNRLYVTSHEHKVFAMNIETGEIIWTYPGTENHKSGYSSPTLFDNKIFLSSLTGHLFALDENTGQELWTVSLTDSTDAVFDSAPVLNYPYITTGSIHGIVYRAHIENGKIDNAFKLSNGYLFASPLIVKDTVYIGSTDGQFYALRFK